MAWTINNLSKNGITAFFHLCTAMDVLKKIGFQHNFPADCIGFSDERTPWNYLIKEREEGLVSASVRTTIVLKNASIGEQKAHEYLKRLSAAQRRASSSAPERSQTYTLYSTKTGRESISASPAAKPTLTELFGEKAIHRVFDFATGKADWMRKCKGYPWLAEDAVIIGYDLEEPKYYNFGPKVDTVKDWQGLTIVHDSSNQDYPVKEGIDLLHYAFEPKGGWNREMENLDSLVRPNGWFLFANRSGCTHTRSYEQWIQTKGYPYLIYHQTTIPPDYPLSEWWHVAMQNHGELTIAGYNYLIVAQKTGNGEKSSLEPWLKTDAPASSPHPPDNGGENKSSSPSVSIILRDQGTIVPKIRDYNFPIRTDNLEGFWGWFIPSGAEFGSLYNPQGFLRLRGKALHSGVDLTFYIKFEDKGRFFTVGFVPSGTHVYPASLARVAEVSDWPDCIRLYDGKDFFTYGHIDDFRVKADDEIESLVQPLACLAEPDPVFARYGLLPHLHFSVSKQLTSSFIDPEPYLFGGMRKIAVIIKGNFSYSKHGYVYVAASNPINSDLLTVSGSSPLSNDESKGLKNPPGSSLANERNSSYHEWFTPGIKEGIYNPLFLAAIGVFGIILNDGLGINIIIPSIALIVIGITVHLFCKVRATLYNAASVAFKNNFVRLFQIFGFFSALLWWLSFFNLTYSLTIFITLFCFFGISAQSSPAEFLSGVLGVFYNGLALLNIWFQFGFSSIFWWVGFRHISDKGIIGSQLDKLSKRLKRNTGNKSFR